MHLVDDFLATGTQIKTERPGRPPASSPSTRWRGRRSNSPTATSGGSTTPRTHSRSETASRRSSISASIWSTTASSSRTTTRSPPLPTPTSGGSRTLAAAGADVQALEDDPRIDLEFPDAEEALEWAVEYDAPLHPEYTLLWHDISVDAFRTLAAAVADGRIEGDADGDDSVLVLEYTESVREALETIVIEHRQRPDEDRLEIDGWRPFVRTLGCEPRRAVADGSALESESGTDAQEPTVDLERTWSDDDLSERARTWGHETEVTTPSRRSTKSLPSVSASGPRPGSATGWVGRRNPRAAI